MHILVILTIAPFIFILCIFFIYLRSDSALAIAPFESNKFTISKEVERERGDCTFAILFGSAPYSNRIETIFCCLSSTALQRAVQPWY